MLDETQERQEAQYAFPYHHLVDYDRAGVRFGKFWDWSINYLGRAHLIVETLKQLQFESVLDIGCGDGKLLSILSDHFNNGANKFHGLDYSRNAIELARALCKVSNVIYEVEDIFSSKKHSTYDIVTLIEVLEHIPPEDVDRFASCVADYMNPGATLICTVPSKNLPLAAKHYQHFDINGLKKVFSRNDLEIVSCKMIDRASWMFNLIRRIFVNRIYLIRSHKLQNFLFSIWKKLCLFGNESSGNGIFLVVRKA